MARVAEHRFRLATRGSALALVQAKHVADRLTAMNVGVEIELVVVTTHGDRRRDLPLSQLGEGVFVKALEEELLQERADLAVHSLKDLPIEAATGLVIAAVPERADPRDALVTRDGGTLADLPSGATVATGSPRRVVQLGAVRPDLRFVGVRGNVDTRLRKLDAGEFDALVIAAAGLDRLGLSDRNAQMFDEDLCTPAVGQGALAVQCRSDHDSLVTLLGQLNDPNARSEIDAERALLVALGGGCKVPVGALARREAEQLRLTAVATAPDASGLARAHGHGDPAHAEALGQEVATELRFLLEAIVGAVGG